MHSESTSNYCRRTGAGHRNPPYSTRESVDGGGLLSISLVFQHGDGEQITVRVLPRCQSRRTESVVSRIVGSFQLVQMLPAWLLPMCRLACGAVRRLLAGKLKTGVAAMADNNPKGPYLWERSSATMDMRVTIPFEAA